MSVAQNAVEDALETILFMSAQNYVQKWISEEIETLYPPVKEPAKNNDGTPKLDAKGEQIYITRPNIIGEAVGGAANVFIMGTLMYIIRYEERFLEKFFVMVNGAITFIVVGGKEFYNKIKNKIKSRRGFGATQLMNNADNSKSERIELAKLVSDRADSVLLGRSNQYQSSSVYSTSVQSLDSANKRNETNHKIGYYQANTQLQLMMFKVMSKNFTQADEVILKKLMRNAQTSTDNPLNMNADDLNKIADYMFVRDELSGKPIGLSTLMAQLLAGTNLSTIKVRN